MSLRKSRFAMFGRALLAGIAAIAPLQASAQDSSDVEEGTLRVTLLGVGAGQRCGEFHIQHPFELQTAIL